MLHDMTIRKKLTLLLMGSCAFAVLLAGIVFYIMTTNQLRKSYEEDLKGLAQILARNCEASLAFQIPEEAERVLSSLSARPSVIYANVADHSGIILAEYGKSRHLKSYKGSKLQASESAAPLSSHLVVNRDIVMGGAVIGSLTLYDNMSGINRARTLAFSMLFFAVAISMGLAYLVIYPLQKVISGPILSLSAAAERISQERDFSLRAEKQGNDEIGKLVDVFNVMIAHIEKRNMELVASEDRFRTLVDQAVDAFFLFDPLGVIVDVNQQSCHSTGYSREELLSGMNFSDLEGGPGPVQPDSGPFATLQPAVPVTMETLYKRKDGSTFPVELRLGILKIGGFSYVMGLARDISDRREAENEKKQLGVQLQQAQKMEAIGQLAGGIAHDFNNMLTAIIGYASLLDDAIDKDSPLKKSVRTILNASKKSADLTRQLLAFSRKQIISPRQTDLNELIRGMGKLLHRLIGEDIDFRTQLACRDLTVLVDPGQIEQVLMNLCTNARDAMPQGGMLSITTEAVHLGREYIIANSIGAIGPYALLSVTDNGKGMSEETRQKIFEPFFTTKEVGKGTGLGLAIVYGIIKQHDGHISVYSEPGKGTTFRIYLPLVEPKTEAAATPEIVIPKRGTETILVAEDNDDVRGLLKNVIENFGYAVIEAINGEDAIKKFMDNKNRVDLVVLDVIMPKKSGKEVCDVIKGMRPDIKILFTSGYTADIINTKGVLAEGIDFISKPVTPNNLLVKIREILDRPTGT